MWYSPRFKGPRRSSAAFILEIAGSMDAMSSLEKIVSELISSLRQSGIEMPATLPEAAVRLGALPVVWDAAGWIGIRGDTTVVSFRWDDEIGGLSVVSDQRTITLAWFQGAIRFPRLKPFVPERPACARICPFCEGTGVPAGLPSGLSSAVVCYCGGAGWLPEQ